MTVKISGNNYQEWPSIAFFACLETIAWGESRYGPEELRMYSQGLGLLPAYLIAKFGISRDKAKKVVKDYIKAIR